ncbi:MAG: hypothetical protein LBS74_02215 [Oscillospiraceae bacterium]|jgi:hypothetical protein|nr:hypothetical protein [Oscillospiraceae bacterium]
MKFLSILKKAAFPAIMAILALLCFVLVIFMGSSVNTSVGYYFYLSLFSVPAISFVLLALWQVKKPSHFQVITVITGVLIPLYLIASLIGLFIFSFAYQLDQSTSDPNKYSTVMRMTVSNNRMSHFPKRIPSDAYNIKFDYWESNWLDANMGCHLSFRATPDTIASLQAKLQKKNKGIKASDYEVPSIMSNDGIFDEDAYSYFGLNYDDTYYGSEDVTFYLFAELSNYRECEWGAAVIHSEHRIIYNYFYNCEYAGE